MRLKEFLTESANSLQTYRGIDKSAISKLIRSIATKHGLVARIDLPGYTREYLRLSVIFEFRSDVKQPDLAKDYMRELNKRGKVVVKEIHTELKKIGLDDKDSYYSNGRATLLVQWPREATSIETKEKILIPLLRSIKHSDGTLYDRNNAIKKIEKARRAGLDYPEFKAIEKSLKLKEGTPEDGITDIWGGRIIKFKDKDAFLKLCLQELKQGSQGEVQHWIKMARDCGYDYPEFKTIEKSLFR